MVLGIGPVGGQCVELVAWGKVTLARKEVRVYLDFSECLQMCYLSVFFFNIIFVDFIRRKV